jgi:integrase
VPTEDGIQPSRGRPGPGDGHRLARSSQQAGTAVHQGRHHASGLVFTHEDGEPLSPSYLTHKFTDLVEETGLPPVRLHDLRHGAATLMLLAGHELKTIADQLSHSSVVLTADTYLSVAVELGLKAAAAAARLVLNAGKSPPGGGAVRRRNAPVLAEITA